MTKHMVRNIASYIANQAVRKVINLVNKLPRDVRTEVTARVIRELQDATGSQEGWDYMANAKFSKWNNEDLNY
jgi:hypothetical protein